jgi:predicted AlkP superfamily phosphohydrolase/phosphomutase
LPPRESTLLLASLLLAACGKTSYKKVIVIGVDGMDPAFVEDHWSDLPNLARLRERGSYSHLETTDPPQSPVAWSTFITGLDPGEHGIFDFVHRDPVTLAPYLSTDKTLEPRFTLPLGSFRLPLSRSRVISLRKGQAFWEYLSDRGIPVSIVRIPANYPPSRTGHEIAGMGTPDLRGTQGTFTYYTDDPGETSHEVSGGLIRKVRLDNNHAVLTLEGPPNTLRKDGANVVAQLSADIDPERPYVRLQMDGAAAIVKEGEWSNWLPVRFPLLPHLVTVPGMFRVYAKQLHPRFELYVSPLNIDPDDPALPIATPASWPRTVSGSAGKWSTLGIPEDTSALRQGVFDLPQFLSQSHLVLEDEQRLLDDALRRFDGGLLFFYFSTVDQNSHVLWGKHEPDLLTIYKAVDAEIGEVMRRQPDADLIVMSDHGFAAFDRAVNLNTFLASRGFRAEAYALGLNGLYLRDKKAAAEIKAELLNLRDPANGRSVIKSVVETDPSPENAAIAPDLIVGYAKGYRASWETALGEAPPGVLEDNDDAWIADHCIDPGEVPAVLFISRMTRAIAPKLAPRLKDLPVSILALYGIAKPPQMTGQSVFP